MLRTRLYLGLVPFLLLLLGGGGYAIHVSRELAGAVQQELVSDYASMLASQRMHDTSAAMAVTLGRGAREDPLAAQKTFETQRIAFMQDLMAESAKAAGRPRAPLIEALDVAFQDFAGRGSVRLREGGGGPLDALGENELALYRVHSALDALNRHDHAATLQTAAHSRELANSTAKVLVIAFAVALFISVVLAWRLSVFLMGPIKELTVSANALGEGDLDRVVADRSNDELGQLARAFNTMAAKLRDYREATLAKVLRTQRTMEATLTSTPDPVFVVDRDGTHAVRNPAAEELARLPEMADGFPAELAEPLARVLESGEHYLPTDYRHVVMIRLGREDRHYLPRILSIGDKLTEFKGAALIFQDVTKFRLLDDAKTNFAGTVSHELKTPLTSLRLAVYLLLEENVGKLLPAQRELLETARDDADRLLRILDNLLDLTRLEAGASTLERKEIAVTALLDAIATEARSFIAAAGATLVVQAPDGIGLVNVDAMRLRHVFINLLTNAAKFSPPGGVVTLAAVAEGSFVRFSVRDEGPGISPESAARVFDRFYREPGQSKAGAGLGLAIAREIVVAHGGSIACTSGIGRGSDFHFLLPR